MQTKFFLFSFPVIGHLHNGKLMVSDSIRVPVARISFSLSLSLNACLFCLLSIGFLQNYYTFFPVSNLSLSCLLVVIGLPFLFPVMLIQKTSWPRSLFSLGQRDGTRFLICNHPHTHTHSNQGWVLVRSFFVVLVISCRERILFVFCLYLVFLMFEFPGNGFRFPRWRYLDDSTLFFLQSSSFWLFD